MEKNLSETFDGEAAVGDFELDGWLRLRLHGIVVRYRGENATWLSINDLSIELNPWSILSKEIHISRIKLEGGILDFGKLQPRQTTPSATAHADTVLALPLSLIIDTCSLANVKVTGPDAEFVLGLYLENLFFRSLDDFSLSYKIEIDQGKIHFQSDSLELGGDFTLRGAGFVSDSISGSQILSLAVKNIVVEIPDPYNIGDFEMTGLLTAGISSGEIIIDSLGLSLNGHSIIDLTGKAVMKPRPRLELDAEKTEWKVAGFADLAGRLGFPIKPDGVIALDEGRFVYTPSGIIYDFALEISDLGFEFGDNFKIEGIDGQVYSDGDLGQIIFGSSLTVKSLFASSPDGSSVRLKGISSAVEAEVSESEYSLNITSGIVDILGGKVDFSAFSQNSKLTGRLKISDMNLAQVSSQAAGSPDTTIFGFLDLTVDIGGVLDSISTILRADARNVTVVVAEDTLELGDQDLEIKSTTLVKSHNLQSSAEYSIGPLIKGSSELSYPMGETAADSMVISFDFNIDNSLIPTYFPSSLSASLGPVDISGWSALKGRLASPVGSVAMIGKSVLTIRPTDLLVEDFRSLLFQLAGISEVDITEDGIDITIQGGIGELYAEEYSDLPFPDVEFRGKMVSTSDTTWRMTDVTAEIPSIKASVTATGDFGIAGDETFSDIIMNLSFKSDDPVAINSLLSIEGALTAQAALKQRGETLAFSGDLTLAGVALTGKDGLYCGAINGTIPFSGAINLNDSLFARFADEAAVGRSTYRRNRSATPSLAGFGKVAMDLVLFGDLSASGIEADILFKNGIVEIPYFAGEILGGGFIGDVTYDLREVNMMREYPDYEKTRYDISFETADLDFNQLVYGLGPFESKANFTSAAYFHGRGIPAGGQDYSIEGTFHISQMGPQTLNRVLDFIDPENQNPAVAQTRGLLNRKFLGVLDMSYKPKEFIVEIKHGALYPGLYMSQPFFADLVPLLKIPMPIRYGRIPLNTVLSGMEGEQ